MNFTVSLSTLNVCEDNLWLCFYVFSSQVTAEDSDESNAGDLKQHLRSLEEKLSKTKKSLALAEREHEDLRKQLDESKKLYSVVQRKNTLLKEQLQAIQGKRHVNVFYLPFYIGISFTIRNRVLSCFAYFYSRNFAEKRYRRRPVIKLY